jgi:hypothetical protein
LADAWAGRRDQIATEYKLDLTGITADTAALKNTMSGPALPPVGTIDVAAGSSIAANSRPMIPDLEDFTFESLPADSRLKVRQIEHNFEEGLKYLHDCSSLKSQYSETSQDYVDTRLKAEEFFRLDQIHQLEIDAGLYEASFKEASDEFTAAEAALVAVRTIKVLATDLLNTGPLSTTKVTENTTWSSELGKATTTQNHDKVAELTGKVTNYRSVLEQSSWQYSLQSNTSAEAQLDGKLRTAARTRDYFQKDVTFRKARTMVSRDVAYASLAEHIRLNSPINYAQQLTQIKKHYFVSASRLAARMRAIARGCQALYGMPVELPDITRGTFFDSAITWMTDIQEKLALKKRSERVVLYTIWLSDHRSNVAEHIKRGIVARVSVSDTGGREGLLRGMDCEYLTQRPVRPIKLNVEPPRDAISDLAVGGGAMPNQLRLGRVLGPTSSSEVSPNFADILWNGNPYGEWRIQGFHDADPLAIQDLALHLWVAQT